VLKLIKDSFHPGDQLVETKLSGSDSDSVAAQAFVTATGRKLLLVNRRNHKVVLAVPDADKANTLTIDMQSGDGEARSGRPSGANIELEPFAVTVVSW
jgi:hypothetical protein